MMRRLIGVVSLITILAVMMTACGKFQCSLCMKEKIGKRHESQETVICNECYEELEELAESLK